jgi:hypothetical protein
MTKVTIPSGSAPARLPGSVFHHTSAQQFASDGQQK